MKTGGRRTALVVIAISIASTLGAGFYFHRELWGALREWSLRRRIDSFLEQVAACEERDGETIRRDIEPAARSLARTGAPLITSLMGRLGRQDPQDPWRRKWMLYLIVQAVPEPPSMCRSIRSLERPLVHIGDDVVCSDSFSDHYGKVLGSPYRIPPGLALAPEEKLPSPGGRWVVQLRTTDASKVPYDREKAALDFLKDDGTTRHLLFEDFRGITVYWLTDRLVFLSSDIGHAAGAMHLFDVEEGRWLYQMGDSYF